MDEKLKTALSQAILVLEKLKFRYAVIGGLANQIWGRARFTFDVDIKVLVPDTDYPAVRNAIRAAFPDRARPQSPENPLIVDAMSGEIIIDFLLAIPGYEENIITRAVQCKVDGLQVWISSPEDLIIQKVVADRMRDWEDVEGILIERHGKLDLPYIEYWIKEFVEALDRPAMLDRFRETCKRVAVASSHQALT